MEPISVPLGGRVEATVMVPVAAGRLPPGTVLRRGDLRFVRRRAVRGAGGGMALRADQVVGRQLAHAVRPGSRSRCAALRPPVLVRKGAGGADPRRQRRGIALTAAGEALDAGGRGRARSGCSTRSPHAVLDALVTGPGQVRVLAGAPPLMPAGGANAGRQSVR